MGKKSNKYSMTRHGDGFAKMNKHRGKNWKEKKATE